jgi:hypothetical protein
MKIPKTSTKNEPTHYKYTTHYPDIQIRMAMASTGASEMNKFRRE